MASKSSHQVSQHHSPKNPAITLLKMIEIALYQPDIAQNAGTIARLCACFGMPLTIIEPAGFAWTDAGFRRAGMDYLHQAEIRRSASWEAFQATLRGRRLVLLSTKATLSYVDFSFNTGDILMLGRESAGVPDHVRDSVLHRVCIPMRPPARSLNVALATAIVSAEALRQLSLRN
jgi:tRNA (cytidine/uridine-2'-O-)-methyltransferase